MNQQPDTLRAAWQIAPTRQIIAHAGDDNGNEGDVIAYAKEVTPNGWNSWAIVRDRHRMPRLVSSCYERTGGRLAHRGNLLDDVLTPRIAQALRTRFKDGEALSLTEQVDLEEWLALFAEPHQRTT